MRLLTCFTAFALVGLLSGAPASDDTEDDKILVTKEYYLEDFVKYKAEHDIVNMLVPLNSINFEEEDSSSSESKESDSDVILFFVEADVQPDGSRVDQGLYVMKGGKATKILDNGRDAAASGDDSRKVFFGAKDGLYVYNEDTNSADKYGTITDSIVGIAKEKSGNAIYILTEDGAVYKVFNNGEKKELLEDVEEAKQIVLDYQDNLYFYSDEKEPWVRTVDGVEKVQGLPKISGEVALLKPPFVVENGVPFLVNNKVYLLYSNGTSELTNFEFSPTAVPTAFAPEAGLIQYYAYDKKIYEYNILALILGSVLEELKNYISKRATDIETIASHRNSIKRKIQA